jgi:hypothetical protein
VALAVEVAGVAPVADTAPQLIWRAFGSRAPEGKTGARYQFEPVSGLCCTCGAEITEGVPFESRRGVVGINNDTFSGHAEYARWGTHACRACAWLYGDPKRTHRAILVVGERGWWPTIKAEMEGRTRWRDLLHEIISAPPETIMTGILTTDPKPRLWPRAQLATCAASGLYVHIPDWDISRWLSFSVREVIDTLAVIDEAMASGVTKSQIVQGIWSSPRIVDRLGVDRVAALESRLAPLRGSDRLILATVIA